MILSYKVKKDHAALMRRIGVIMSKAKTDCERASAIKNLNARIDLFSDTVPHGKALHLVQALRHELSCFIYKV